MVSDSSPVSASERLLPRDANRLVGHTMQKPGFPNLLPQPRPAVNRWTRKRERLMSAARGKRRRNSSGKPSPGIALRGTPTG
jgi:hypothetical protein